MEQLGNQIASLIETFMPLAFIYTAITMAFIVACFVGCFIIIYKVFKEVFKND